MAELDIRSRHKTALEVVLNVYLNGYGYLTIKQGIMTLLTLRFKLMDQDRDIRMST